MTRSLKKYLAALLLLLASCAEPPAEAQQTNVQQTFAPPGVSSTAGAAPANGQGLATATFAGGCFW